MTTKSLRQRKPVSLTNSRWTAYATAGAATAIGCAATTENALGSIHYSGPLNQVFHAPTNSTTSSLNSVTGTFTLGAGASFGLRQFFHSSGTNGHASFALFAGAAASFIGYRTGGFNSGYLSKLVAGAVLNANTNFQASTTFPDYIAKHGFGQFTTAGIGIAGFRFNTGAGLQYGWVRFNMEGGPGNGFTLIDYAWGDVGDTVLAGQVPEPGSLALLALGGVGLLAWRKRRAQTVAKS